MADPTPASFPEIDDVDVDDEMVAFHKDLLDMVKMVYRHDRSQSSNPSKKFLDYIKVAPKHGLEKNLTDIRHQLVEVYTKNRDDILEGYDDWIFKPDPLLLKVNRKIYMAIGNIYARVDKAHWDEIHGAIIKTLSHVATNPNDKVKLVELVGTKEKKSEGGFMSMIQGMMGGGGAEGLGGILEEIKGKLGATLGNPEDPESLDASKIGDLVKNLITDKSSSGLFAKMASNPALANMAQKMAQEGGGLGKL
jgi:hypothetical protein